MNKQTVFEDYSDYAATINMHKNADLGSKVGVDANQYISQLMKKNAASEDMPGAIDQQSFYDQGFNPGQMV